jgi:hypothetical protein
MYDLDLSPLELAFVSTNDSDVKACQQIQQRYGTENFVKHWLQYKNLPEDMIPTEADENVG